MTVHTILVLILTIKISLLIFLVIKNICIVMKNIHTHRNKNRFRAVESKFDDHDQMSFSSNSKLQFSCRKLFVFSLLFLSFSLIFLVFSFNPRSNYTSKENIRIQATGGNNKWLEFLAGKIGNGDEKRIKIGLVNVDERLKHAFDKNGLVETVSVVFQRVSGDLQWKDLFPEWIDEKAKWAPPSCPELPMPRMEEYRGLDVVVARVPCGGGRSPEEGRKGMRDVFRLQVNLVVANLVVENGWGKSDEVDRTVYVVFIGSCGPMQEMFRCDDLLTHVGEYWVYKPDMRKLKQKVVMPVGSCQIAPPFAETGKEVWRHFMSKSVNNLNQTRHLQKVAYATILHSSEAYVCGAIALAHSIKQTNSTKDLILLHDSSITTKSLHGLRAAGWKTRLIRPIRSPFAKKDSYNEWNYSKLRIWQLLDYDKVIFIDADIIILRNIDKFFVYPQLSAAANDKVLFNSGIMVIEPSMCTFDHLMSKTSKIKSYNGGDQGFLNEVFPWWHRLPSKMNTMKIFQKPVDKDHQIEEESYGVHFLGLKPWLCYKDYDCNWDKKDHQIFASDSAHKRWWQVHEAMPKKLQSFCKLTKKMDARIRKWRRIAKEENLADGHWKIRVTDPRQHHLLQ